MIILIFCLLLEYVSLRSLPFIDCEYLSTSTISPNVLMDPPINITELNNTYENKMHAYKIQEQLNTKLISNYTKQLQQQQLLINQKTDIITHYEAMNNPLSFEQWIKGIGNTKLSNEGFSDTCIVPNIPDFQLSKSAAEHKDPFYSKIHDCNDKKKWTQLIEINKYERYIIINRNKFECKTILQYQSASILRGNLDKINEDNLWIEIDDNYDYKMNKSLIKLPLYNLSQTIWIACNRCEPLKIIYIHYVSVLPLKIRSPKRYKQQFEKYKNHSFTRQRMPNVIIFVVDSTSRSNFHRGSI